MKTSAFINNDTLNSYFSDVLAKYDTDKNGFNQKEFSGAIKGMTTIFAKNLIRVTKYDKKFFKELDTNKDTIVSYEELEEYVKTEYGLDFKDFFSMKISDICTAIDNAKKQIKNNCKDL